MAREEGYRQKPRPEEADLDTVILERTTVPTRAGLIRALLESEGIVVSTPGYTASSTAGLTGDFDIVIRVPKKDLERARAVLEERNALSSRITTPTPRRFRIAALAALVPSLGMGHAHAGAYLSAGILATLEIVAIVSSGWILLSGVLVPLVIALDVAGSREACARANRGEPMGRWLTKPVIVGALLVPLLLGVLAGWGDALVAGSNGAAFCDYLERCEGTARGGCLRTYALERLDGVADLSDACARCLSRDEDCELSDRCVAACGW